MRISRLSALGSTSSSRQSPRMSADSDGFFLVPLFETVPGGSSRTFSVPLVPSPLVIRVPSSSSARRSPPPPTPRLAAGAGARVPLGEVYGHAATGVAVGRRRPEQLAGARVEHRRTAIAAHPHHFMDPELLEPRAGGVEIRDVHRIAMAEPRGDRKS